jgi:heme/copper-type cytochrome/quinol oxidase subunit 2
LRSPNVEFEKAMLWMLKSVPVLVSMSVFLLVYALVIAFVFRANARGRRRRWLPLDYVWVPLGGLTGLCLLALWWRMHGAA